MCTSLQDNWTALLNACQLGNLGIVRILLDYDARIEHNDCVSLAAAGAVETGS